jgi:hypothetical protein
MSPVKQAFQEAFMLFLILPAETVWSVTLTHDTEPENTAAFNLYVANEEERVKLRKHLKLGPPSWEDDVSEEHTYTPRITLSIIEEKIL